MLEIHILNTLTMDLQGQPDASGYTVYQGQDGKKLGKPRVVVLGSGWGAMSFVKSLTKADRFALAASSARLDSVHVAVPASVQHQAPRTNV
jgi:hypothetical protein